MFARLSLSLENNFENLSAEKRLTMGKFGCTLETADNFTRPTPSIGSFAFVFHQPSEYSVQMSIEFLECFRKNFLSQIFSRESIEFRFLLRRFSYTHELIINFQIVTHHTTFDHRFECVEKFQVKQKYETIFQLKANLPVIGEFFSENC